MHAPNRAAEIHSASVLDFSAGICRSSCSFKQSNGWFVPYRQVPNSDESYDAVISLYVKDLTSPFFDTLPFVIDTGTDITIIPRKGRILESGAFPLGEALGESQVRGLTGRTIVGRRFRAAFSIVSRQTGIDPLIFSELNPIIVDYWEDDYGMLGLDALRQVVMVSDREHISLWPMPDSPCQATEKTD